ncbi:hypothetical protein NGRA_2404 [Nosema granulosis]|uniref:Uncharacterized protein n=1 Tax=Nosema granulosis TaxID=83296 RepID=A0A9P6GY64_9MICR|nr:hypothetical protein NGRA_2404 [Nosema granulosis]
MFTLPSRNNWTFISNDIIFVIHESEKHSIDRRAITNISCPYLDLVKVEILSYPFLTHEVFLLTYQQKSIERIWGNFRLERERENGYYLSKSDIFILFIEYFISDFITSIFIHIFFINSIGKRYNIIIQ